MTPVTSALLTANVALFLLEGAAGPGLVGALALWPPSGGALPPFEPWQLVSYAFLHDGFAHIAFNMLALYMFGQDLERLFGARFFLQYYLASVVTGALTHLAASALMGAEPLPLVGASGGVFGLLLAFGWFFPQRRLVFLLFPVPLPARVFVAGYGLLELVLGVTGTQTGVAHFAHLGGMLGGWLAIQWRRGGFPFGRR